MNIDGVIEKLKCATRCHPNAIETLINEAIEMLEAERDDVFKRKHADELADAGDLYADVYCQIVDLIDPHVNRGFNDSGELPASVVHSVEFLFEFWIQHKAEREAMMKQEPVEYQQFIRLNFNWQRITKEKYEQLEKEGDAVIRKLFSYPLPAQQIPEGYALVPIEPTEEMRDAANRIDELASEKEILSSDHFMNIYNAMVLSASQPKGDV